MDLETVSSVPGSVRKCHVLHNLCSFLSMYIVNPQKHAWKTRTAPPTIDLFYNVKQVVQHKRKCKLRTVLLVTAEQFQALKTVDPVHLFLSLSLPPVFEFRPLPKWHSAVA